jgi:hypothetical protein
VWVVMVGKLVSKHKQTRSPTVQSELVRVPVAIEGLAEVVFLNDDLLIIIA